MNKELPSLQSLAYLCENKKIDCNPAYQETEIVLECINDIENSLKALEIIKTKKVDIKALIESDYIWQYNSQLEYHPEEDELTQEEYDLLKEVLL